MTCGCELRWGHRLLASRRRLRNPPFAIAIETAHGDVGIIHAGPVRRSSTRTVAELERVRRGDVVEIAASTVPAFKAGKALREAVRQLAVTARVLGRIGARASWLARVFDAEPRGMYRSRGTVLPT